VQFQLEQSYKVAPQQDDDDRKRFEDQTKAREKIFKDLAKSLRMIAAQVVAAHEASTFPDAAKRFRFQQNLLESLMASAQRDPDVPLPIGQFTTLLAKPDKTTRDMAEKATKPADAWVPPPPPAEDRGYGATGRAHGGRGSRSGYRPYDGR
jgi:hypothetical protein